MRKTISYISIYIEREINFSCVYLYVYIFRLKILVVESSYKCIIVYLETTTNQFVARIKF